MNRHVRIAWRLSVLLVLILGGLLAVSVIYPWSGAAARAWMNRSWSRALLWTCGLRVSARGQPLASGPVLFVANHVSWLDIFVMNSLRPTAFVAKQEIRRWPVVGWLVAGAGTLFIERGSRRAMHAVGQAMQARFERNEAVGLFPEGTTSDGLSLLPMHTGLLEPARFGGVPIQPLALVYSNGGARSRFPAFVGEETLVRNLFRILGARHLDVCADYAPPVVGEALGRAALADRVRAALIERLQMAPGARD